ncbi:hypothetical protein BDV25DRAFT_143664 [Aspergillus avenaceus]|uniref:BTB domain-containing protein n=1 Tax=Aspergillus avenaceus TaxID=36643 RepID=A0A5N6TK22_ASPAV|nr:hypothetical protein BDV25DRAFT_143664 [Aspergillus avenaceus]
MVSGFPFFEDGDVSIRIHQDVYQLHSSVLKAQSRHIRDLLESLGPHGIGHFGYLQLELVETKSHGYGVLEIRDTDDSYDQGLIYYGQKRPIVSWSADTRRHWSNIFKIFYKLSPQLHDGDIKNVLGHCWDLVSLADSIRSTRVVFPAIESALHELGQKFYALVIEDATNWIKLGTYMRSAFIFKEAAIHVIGNWNALGNVLDYLPTAVHELCETKQANLLRLKFDMENRILSYFPGERVHCGSVGPGHRHYAKNVILWQAITSYMHWIKVQMAKNRCRFSPDGGAWFYRAINAGNITYSDTEEKAASSAIQRDPDKIYMLNSYLVMVQESVKGFVADLLVNESRYDPAVMGQLPYLTCCKVEDDELPWMVWPDGDWYIDSEEEDLRSNCDSDDDDSIQYSGDDDDDAFNGVSLLSTRFL